MKNKKMSIFEPHKWLVLERALNDLVVLNTTLQLSAYGAEFVEDTESLALVINLACDRLNSISKDVKQAMDEWESSANYMD